MNIPRGLVLFSIIITQGCSTLPSIEVSEASSLHLAQHQFSNIQKWWLAFNDPLLNEFAEQILHENLDLKIAQVRIEESRALMTIATSNFFPDLSIQGQTQRGNTTFSSAQSLSQAGFNTQWELDLFGRTHASVQSAKAHVLEKEATIDDIRNTLIADIAFAVIRWRQSQNTIQENNKLLQSQENLITLLHSQVTAGLIDATHVKRARSQYHQTKTQLPLAVAASKTAQYQIERLLNSQDNWVTETLSTFKQKPLIVPSAEDTLNLSIDMIQNRPDIRIARANFWATQANLAQAEANLWPKITLNSFFGVETGTNRFLVAPNPIWTLGANFMAPFLNFGRLNGAIDAANAQSQQALLTLENSIAIALQETRTALSDYLEGINNINAQEHVVQQRQETKNIVQERFDRGLTNMIDLATAQIELDQTILILIAAKTNAAEAFIRLQKTLGVATIALQEQDVLKSTS